MFIIRTDAQGLPQVEAPLPTAAPKSWLEARHLKFWRNMLRAQKRDDDEKKDDEKDSESDNDDDKTSSKTKSSTSSSSSGTSISSSAISSFSTSVTSSSISSSTRLSTTMTSTMLSLSTSATLVQATSTSVQIVVVASTSGVFPLASVATSPSSSTKATAIAGAVIGQATAPASTSTSQQSKTSSGMVAGIVSLVLGVITLTGFVIWFLLRRQRRSREAAELEYENENEDRRAPSVVQRAQAPVFVRPEAFGSRRQQTESTIWGSTRASTAYTEANFVPPPVPASMQPGGVYNNPLPTQPRQGQEYGNGVASQLSTSLQPTNNVVNNHGSGVTVDAAGFVRVPARWLSRISRVSLPRYRDVTSWVQDGRRRRSTDGGSEASEGPYQKF